MKHLLIIFSLLLTYVSWSKSEEETFLIERLTDIAKTVAYVNANDRGTIEGCIEASEYHNDPVSYKKWTELSDYIFHDYPLKEILYVISNIMVLTVNDQFPGSIDTTVLESPSVNHERYQYQYKLYAKTNFGRDKCLVNNEDSIYDTWIKMPGDVLPWGMLRDFFPIFNHMYPSSTKILIQYIRTEYPSYTKEELDELLSKIK